MDSNVSVSLILLAGGLGTRMQAPLPKQFLPLGGKPVVLYSFDVFLSMPEVFEIVVVCDPAYHHIFQKKPFQKRLIFAAPGERRQDSVFNGFKKTAPESEWIGIHDSARPFITSEMARSVIAAAREKGAAALGMPIKFTVKECDAEGWVRNTPSRDALWEIQTPQVIRRDLLQKGFDRADQLMVTVTDDVSLVELLSQPVRIVKGSYNNIKITTPEDFLAAESIRAGDYGKSSVQP